jgi:hypothetical protein
MIFRFSHVAALVACLAFASGCATADVPPPPEPVEAAMISDPELPATAITIPRDRFADALLGRWEVEVRETPYGTLRGSMVFQETDDDRGIRALFDVPDLSFSTKLHNLRYDGDIILFDASAVMDGRSMDISGKGVLEADEMRGELVVSGVGTLPFSAVRF